MAHADTEQTTLSPVSNGAALNIVSYKSHADGATLHVSKETLEQFTEILGKVPEWIGHPMDLSILHADDIERASKAAGIPLEELPKRASELADKLGDYFPDTPISRMSQLDDSPSELINIKKQLMQGAYQDYPIGFKYSLEDDSIKGKSKEQENGVLAMPRGDQTVIDYFSRQTGIPVSKLENISGSARDLNYARVGHESAHFNDHLIYVPPSVATDKDARLLKDEIFSDNAQNHLYFKEIEKGNPLDKTVPETIRGALALRGFLTDTFTHATGPDFCLPKEPCPEIYQNVGNGEERYQRALDLKQSLSDAREKVYARIQKDTGISGEEAQSFGQDQPELFYETIKTLEHEGAFRKSDDQQAYADQFLQAAEKYAPGHFGVDLEQNVSATFLQEGNDFSKDDNTVFTSQEKASETMIPAPPPASSELLSLGK